MDAQAKEIKNKVMCEINSLIRYCLFFLQTISGKKHFSINLRVKLEKI
jgi:hypothetical protein